MLTLQTKVAHAVAENRILILGMQVFLGFQFESFFQEAFGSIPEHSRIIMLGGLLLQLITLLLLVAPVAYHRIVRAGEETTDVLRYVWLMTGRSLFPFALGLAMSFLVATERIFNFTVALAVGIAVFLVAIFFWYGLEFVRKRQKRKGKSAMSAQEQADGAPLRDKIDRDLAEIRIILPGSQALLGFQFVIIHTRGFDTIPEWLRALHLASLVCVAISIILLMAPAAYHRIVEGGEASEQLHRFMNRMMILAIAFLSLGISGDTTVVVGRVINVEWIAIAGGAAILCACLGLWFVYTLYRRHKYQNG